MNTLVLMSAVLLVLVVVQIQAMPTAEEVLVAVKKENAHKISKRSGSSSSGGRGFRGRRFQRQPQFFPRQQQFFPQQQQFFPRQTQFVPRQQQFFPQQAIGVPFGGRNSPQIQTSQIIFPLNLGGQVRQPRLFRGNNYYQPFVNNVYPGGQRRFNNYPLGGSYNRYNTGGQNNYPHHY